MMLDRAEEWSISFAGCGFRSIYYVGALSCILEQVPQLVHGASKICGASSGCLVAAALAVGIPIEELCTDILTIAREARNHTLGVFHPTFSLLRAVQDSLLQKLPEDAHLRATGRLCVSLTRMSDGSNVLVSEFASRAELIQVLMCSCFFPVYSGFIPPSYRGVRYMDGALSNNVPLCEQRNTLIMAPFSGESDICPREGTYNFLEVHFGNVSIQVNTGNVHRVCTSFFPPRIQMLAEICHNGYKDALFFLKQRDLLGPQTYSHAAVRDAAGDKWCCELVTEAGRMELKHMAVKNGKLSASEDHQWLDPRVIESLPQAIQRVLCEACRDSSQDSATWWPHLMYPLRLLMYLLSVLMLPIQLTQQLIKRLMMSAALYRWTWRNRSCDHSSEQLCSTESSDLSDQTGGDQNSHMLMASTQRDFDKDLCWEKECGLDVFPSSSADASACVRETSNSVTHANTGKQKLHRKKTV